MAYTGVSRLTIPSTAGPHPSYPRQFVTAQLPTSVLDAVNPLHQDHHYSAGPIRSQSSSRNHPPYDIAQSPTRTRFSLQDTNIHAAYAIPPAGYPPVLDQRQAPIARVERRPSISKAPRRLRDENSFGEPDLSTPTVAGPTNHVLVTAPLQRKDPTSTTIWFQKKDFPEPGVTYDEILFHPGSVPLLKGDNDKVLEATKCRSINVMVNWPGYTTEPKCISPHPIHLNQITRHDLLIRIARLLRDWLKKVTKLKSTDPYFAIRTEEDFGRVFITSLVHLEGSNWQVHLWTVDKKKTTKGSEWFLPSPPSSDIF